MSRGGCIRFFNYRVWQGKCQGNFSDREAEGLVTGKPKAEPLRILWESDMGKLQKAWEVLLPYLLYYLVYNVAYLVLAFAYQATVRFGGAYEKFMMAHAANVAGVMGGLCMLAGILPVVPMLKEELRGRGETLCPKTKKEAGSVISAATVGTAGGTGKVEACEDAAGKLTKLVSKNARRMAVLTVILAFSVSLGFNALLTLTGFADSSQTYQKVADRQYGVTFALGLVLYGLISPLAEEVVFRGVIYNRLRRLYNSAIGIVASGLLFGAFHGNPVQGVYGACLGMLMAYLYEKSGKFGTPFLFHAVANLAVYTTARMEGVQALLLTPAGCAVLLAVSAGCVLAVQKTTCKMNTVGLL